MAADGPLTLVAAQDGLLIVDLNNPANPQLLSKTTLNNDQGFAIAAANKVAYLGIYDLLNTSGIAAYGYAAILAYDYQDPNHPRLVSQSFNGQAATFLSSLWMSGTQQLFAAAYSPPPFTSPVAMKTFDVSQPRSVIDWPIPLLDPSVAQGGSIAGFSHKGLVPKPTMAQV